LTSLDGRHTASQWQLIAHRFVAFGGFMVPTFKSKFGNQKKEREWIVLPLRDGRMIASADDLLCHFNYKGAGTLISANGEQQSYIFPKDFVQKAMEVCPAITGTYFEDELRLPDFLVGEMLGYMK
jgi:hypothetical protein